jgi:hypothetical protein
MRSHNIPDVEIFNQSIAADPGDSTKRCKRKEDSLKSKKILENF